MSTWEENYPGHVTIDYQKLRDGGCLFPICFVISEKPFVKQIVGGKATCKIVLTIKKYFSSVRLMLSASI